MRRSTLRLYRLTPPWRATIQVRPITVGQFLDLTRLLVGRIAELVVALQKDIEEQDLLKANWERELYAFADMICEGQPAGFFRKWCGPLLTTRNFQALLQATRQAEGDGGWARILGCLNLSGKPDNRRSSVMGDVIAFSQSVGADPHDVLDRWPMQRFLDVIEGMRVAGADEDATPAPLGMLAAIPGVSVIH